MMVFFTIILFAQPIISPTSIILANIQLKRKNIIKALKLKNTTTQKAKYKISIHTLKELNKSPRLSYYSDLPTSDWFIPKSTTITVPAGGVGYVKDIYIKIPKKERILW
ncbi:MAG: hypothetical protein DRI36_03240 [Caldiserica bacterium]|nr:MAG: hypothetical protein DRI36_03240 [Caldisericota bacterium]